MMRLVLVVVHGGAEVHKAGEEVHGDAEYHDLGHNPCACNNGKIVLLMMLVIGGAR